MNATRGYLEALGVIRVRFEKACSDYPKRLGDGSADIMSAYGDATRDFLLSGKYRDLKKHGPYEGQESSPKQSTV